MLSGYHSPIDAIRDSIDRNIEGALVRERNRQRKDVEFGHFKNVVVSRLGSDPAVAKVISTWRPGKEPVNCVMQILNVKNWSQQQRTDINAMYISFKHLNEEILDAERKYGQNPQVRVFIDSIRKGDDIRPLAFERKLQRILNNKEVM